MNAYPRFKRRKTFCLDGLWEFSFLGDGVDLDLLDVNGICFEDRLPVPSAFDAYPSYAGKRGTAVYRTAFDFPVDCGGMIEFLSAGSYCQIYLDGQQVCVHHPSYVRFTVPVPPSQRPRRELLVVIDNRFDPKRAPLQESFFDFYNYGGILRSVTVHELPKTFLEYCHVIPRDIVTGDVEVTVHLGGQLPVAIDLNILIDGGNAMSFENLPVEDGAARVSLRLPHPSTWSPEAPNLHTLAVDTGQDDMIVRFGLREVRAKGGKILLNGKPVKLLGVCRHEAHPQFGPALPYQQLVQDVELLQDLGCNFVRGSHYPQDQRFLDLCDERGILFFEESMGWGQNKSHFTNPDFVQAQLDQTKTMIMTSFNHPCVLMWGFLNEGESDVEEARHCYESLIALIRKTDPSRLVTYASFKRRTDLFLHLVDVVCYNTYPGWYNAFDDEYPLGQVLPKIRSDVDFLGGRADLKDKPFILSEIGGGALYGWKDPLNGPWTEEFQAELLKIVCGEVVGNEAISGVSIWQFFDGRTYNCGRALGRPRAFNNKGLLDEYRRPKQSYFQVREIFREYASATCPK